MRKPNNMGPFDTLIWYGWDEVDRGLPDRCWEWRGPKHKAGYGNIRTKTLDGRQTFVRAHRIALSLSGVIVPDELHVLHECDNPPCVNPKHLRSGTDADNAQDRIKRGRNIGPHGMVGENNPTSKLTEAQVVMIKSLLAQHKLSQETIGKMYGVTQSAIWKINTERSWSHIPWEKEADDE